MNNLNKEVLLDFNIVVNLVMDLCAPGLLAWAKDREVHYSGVSQVVDLLGQGAGQEMPGEH
eukprot:11819392-Prorocentrum_lima.AAC.1